PSHYSPLSLHDALPIYPIYRDNYGIARLRRFLDQRSAFSDYEDLAHSLGVLWEIFRNPQHAELLQLAPLNGDLFDPQLLDSCSIDRKSTRLNSSHQIIS